MKKLKSLSKLTPFQNFHWQIPVLLVLSAIVLLWKLGQGSLKDWDEAIYAQIAKEIVQSGDWLTLHWGYYPWFHKPPLFMWVTALFYRLFEVNEFWARAASAFSGISLVILTYLLGKLVYDKTAGFFAAIVLLTSYRFVGYSRFGTTDMMLALFVYLAVYAYLKLKDEQPKWWYLVWVACGLAFMTKGIASLVAPITIFLALLLEKKLISTIKTKHFWQGFILASILVLPWHLAVYFQHGQVF
ncbi:MAG: glycosyltransferase family 39 protein [Spirulinaceae cyanobacterium]